MAMGKYIEGTFSLLAMGKYIEGTFSLLAMGKYIDRGDIFIIGNGQVHRQRGHFHYWQWVST